MHLKDMNITVILNLLTGTELRDTNTLMMELLIDTRT